MSEKKEWLNRSTVGISLASLLSDISHELGTSVLPIVLISIGAGPAALGIIEGISDGFSALFKLASGIWTDRIEKRKPLASAGYFLTAFGMTLIGISTQWWHVLLCRMTAWIGRGSRGPARDVLMTEATTPENQGKAFGMERAGDALGAVIGPLIGFFLMAKGLQARHILLWSFIPGILAFLSMTLLVVEKPFKITGTPRTFKATLEGVGAPFKKYLTGIFIFGCGDFSRTLLILYATKNLTGDFFSWTNGTVAIALYVIHNAVSSLAAFPIGALADHFGSKKIMLSGYFFAGLTTLGFALLPATPILMLVLFICSGLYIACEEVCEKSFAAQLLPKESKGTGMGLLAATNGVADLISSVLLGLLWSQFPHSQATGFIVMALFQFSGFIRLL